MYHYIQLSKGMLVKEELAGKDFLQLKTKGL
jgi:hypothetical protein